MWFRSKYREMCSDLSEQVAELTQELNAERSRRISAEAIAEERRERADRSDEYAKRAETARDEAVKSKVDSIDLVNTALLRAINPEGAPKRDIKEFTSLTSKKPAPPIGRRADRLFMKAVETSWNSKKTPKSALGNTAAADIQMDSLAVDKLIQ